MPKVNVYPRPANLTNRGSKVVAKATTEGINDAEMVEQVIAALKAEMPEWRTVIRD